jgi:hypothetical protein
LFYGLKAGQWSMSRAPALVLRQGDRERLAELARFPSVPSGLAKRARIVLLAADGTDDSNCPSCRGVWGSWRLRCRRLAWCWFRACQGALTFGARSAGLAGPGAAGCGVGAAGCGDALATGGFDAVVPEDAEPVSGSAPRAELPVVDPVVDDAGAAAVRLAASATEISPSAQGPGRGCCRRGGSTGRP